MYHPLLGDVYVLIFRVLEAADEVFALNYHVLSRAILLMCTGC